MATSAPCQTIWKTTTAVAEIGGAIDHLRAHARSNGKVGVVGFCMGGALTFAAACHLGKKLDAAVPFYGIPPAEKRASWCARSSCDAPSVSTASRTLVHAESTMKFPMTS